MAVTSSYKAFFDGKRVTLMGLGLLGRGIGDAAFMAACGAKVLVTDRKSEAELAPALAVLALREGISYALGGHKLEDFRDADMVVKAAGVPLDSPFIAEAKKHGVPVYMSTALFAKFAGEAGATIVGVTGTRGKSTVAALIHHVLTALGKRSFLAGNVRGISTLALLPEIRQGDVVVLELDSWQLQGFGELKLSPQVAVFTNFMTDHLNYYPDLNTYFSDKANLFRFQKSGDFLVVGPQALERVRAEKPMVEPVVPQPLPEVWKLRLVGEHNRENAALAAEALRALGLSEEVIRAGLETFEPVEGRLQPVADVAGAAYYNDNNATTPEATLAALKALSQPVIAIVGGADKGLPLEALAEALGKTKNIILLPGSGTDRLKPLLSHFEEVASLEEAVRLAKKRADEGDAVLFSPAFASFGLFKNEYDRNDSFLRAVRAL